MIDVTYNAGMKPVSGMTALIWIAVLAAMLAAMWKIFVKAGEHGWAVLVPFYGNYCQFRMAFGNGWLFLLMLVPFVNFVVAVLMFVKLAKAFGKGIGFALGLMFLSPVFLCILGFGDAEYIGPQ